MDRTNLANSHVWGGVVITCSVGGGQLRWVQARGKGLRHNSAENQQQQQQQHQLELEGCTTLAAAKLLAAEAHQLMLAAHQAYPLVPIHTTYQSTTTKCGHEAGTQHVLLELRKAGGSRPATEDTGDESAIAVSLRLNRKAQDTLRRACVLCLRNTMCGEQPARRL